VCFHHAVALKLKYHTSYPSFASIHRDIVDHESGERTPADVHRGKLGFRGDCGQILAVHSAHHAYVEWVVYNTQSARIRIPCEKSVLSVNEPQREGSAECDGSGRDCPTMSQKIHPNRKSPKTDGLNIFPPGAVLWRNCCQCAAQRYIGHGRGGVRAANKRVLARGIQLGELGSERQGTCGTR
jgi:hypothetical protein